MLTQTNKSWTGERLETFVFGNATIEHLHRYAIALQLVKGKDVADIACGEGYGTNLLAGTATYVTGVDISEESISEAKEKYTASNISFFTADATQTPIDASSVDVVLSFETIEHLERHEQMMLEIKRILRPGGVLIMSSPDKKYYSDIPNHKNIFHVKELYFDEFKSLINKHFVNAKYFFQNTFKASVVIPEMASKEEIHFYTGDFNKITREDALIPLYNIVIASDEILPEMQSSIFNGNEIDLINIKNQLTRLEKQIKNIKNSKRYKLAGMLEKPVKLVRRLAGK